MLSLIREGLQISILDHTLPVRRTHEKPQRSKSTLPEIENVRHVVLKLHEKMYRDKKREGKMISELMTYADKVLATVLGIFSAQTFFKILTSLIGEDEADMSAGLKVFVRAIYVVIVTFFCVTGGYSLNKRAHMKEDAMYTHSQLLRLSIPMLLGWAWKDLASDLIGFAHQTPGAICALAAFTLVSVALLERSKRYALAVKHEYSIDDTMKDSFLRIPRNLYLAVGYIWNYTISFPKSRLFDGPLADQASFYRLAVQGIWCVLVTQAISRATAVWKAHYEKIIEEAVKQDREDMEVADAEDKRQKQQQARQEEQPLDVDIGIDVTGTALGHSCSVSNVVDHLQDLKAGGTLLFEETAVKSVQVLLNAMTFVYGWQVLDTVNIVFFDYILDCGAPSTCSYQDNLGFSIIISVCFMRLSAFLHNKIRWKGTQKYDMRLFTNAMSLTVGWAWMNFCNRAIDAVVESSDIHQLVPYFICFSFVLPAMSFLHFEMHNIKKAWDIQTQNEITEDYVYIARLYEGGEMPPDLNRPSGIQRSDSVGDTTQSGTNPSSPIAQEPYRAPTSCETQV